LHFLEIWGEEEGEKTRHPFFVGKKNVWFSLYSKEEEAWRPVWLRGRGETLKSKLQEGCANSKEKKRMGEPSRDFAGKRKDPSFFECRGGETGTSFLNA